MHFHLSWSATIAVVLLSYFSLSNAVTIRLGEICASSDTCADGEFCGTSDTCEAIPFTALPISSPATPSNSTTDPFNIIMVTDVQFYFRICKNQPTSDCIFDGELNDKDHRNGLLEDAAVRQKDCIDHLASTLANPVNAVFNNGDITNSGRAKELRRFKNVFHEPVKALGHAFGMVVCLGNHDYAMATGSDARMRMVNFLEESIDEMSQALTVRSLDWETSGIIDAHGGTKEKFTEGSLCFSVELNGYVFIVLHWSAGLGVTGGDYTTEFNAANSAGYTEYVKVTSGADWLKLELQTAKDDGKPVVIVPHSYKGLLNLMGGISGLSDDLHDSSAIGVLSGHVHDNWGKYTDLTIGTTTTRTIPVYYAGSTSYERLISVGLDRNAVPEPSLDVTVYDTSSVTSDCSVTGLDDDDTP